MLWSKEIMRNPKDSYVCPRCGYVLPKEDAVVSGWDSEGSLRHVHCPMWEDNYACALRTVHANSF